jgi:nucleotide-binding universal stress UspA family protein
MGAFVTLAGVVEPNDRSAPVAHLLVEAEERLRMTGVPWRRQILNGYAEQVVLQWVSERPYDLLVIGPLGRPAWRRWLLGRSIRHFLEELSLPLCYVPQGTWPPRHVLVCLGGLGYAVRAQQFAQRVATQAGAELTLLHVVPPLEMEYPVAREIQEDWQHVHQSHTVIGRSLRRALKAAKDAGLRPRLRVRHGSVVEEILAEIAGGEYDLVCMGSPHGVDENLRQLFTPNVTAEVAEHSDVPVYVARQA